MFSTEPTVLAARRLFMACINDRFSNWLRISMNERNLLSFLCPLELIPLNRVPRKPLHSSSHLSTVFSRGQNLEHASVLILDIASSNSVLLFREEQLNSEQLLALHEVSEEVTPVSTKYPASNQ